MDIDDYWDKNGEAIPYILLELGGTVTSKGFYSTKEYTKIGTCFDRQEKIEKNILYFKSGYYAQIIKSVEEIFIPIIAIENKTEKKQ